MVATVVRGSGDDPQKTGRGAFILFEGVDRCGKTTQSQRLVQHLKNKGVGFPSPLQILPDMNWEGEGKIIPWKRILYPG